MYLSDNLKDVFEHEHLSARDAQHLAHIYSWGPVVFQVARLMIKYGIFELLSKSKDGLTQEEICTQTHLSPYAVKCLLEASLTMYTIQVDTTTDRYTLGKTGRFALRCVQSNPTIHVTVCDLPPQIVLMREATKGYEDRIDGIGMDLLDPSQPLPSDKHYDVIWMSQFLDCFSEEQIISILRRVKTITTDTTRVFIMETLWDRQTYPPAAFCLTQTSLYFTALANGNSKMYNTDDMSRLITTAGLQIDTIHDNIGKGGHSIIVCK